MEVLSRCGYRCDLCQAYIENIEINDQREALQKIWQKYYDIDMPIDAIYCEGCKQTDVILIDTHCPIRTCSKVEEVDKCSECTDFPCDIFYERKGLSFEEAKMKAGEAFDEKEFYDFLVAYDNLTRLIQLKRGNSKLTPLDFISYRRLMAEK